ncbi:MULTISPECIES: polymorphic toxin-type HINT domain-containing protein [unclassified Crossiella]|uniref:polymorphic toxin-type HINT domain-containing protein n=1 Tax=unclassified Crossiella TaxID=2620835 RepID=UPI001FFE3B49|nr:MULTISPECIES: polymorphic toxin-type HINT domain-containing protein [unclassified Crossiella]MCK2240646.1 putative toxin [Crossiella sp. S99.2]MCK2252903.1 putative toxin [Crossiella sp. S99.1]
MAGSEFAPRRRRMFLFGGTGLVLALVAGLTVWLAWPTPPRDRSAFEQAVAALAEARGVRYTDTTITGQKRDITTTEFGAQFGVTGHAGLENLDQGVLTVDDKVYTKFKNNTDSKLGKWTADQAGREQMSTGLIDEFPSPADLADRLSGALAELPDLPSTADPDLPALTIAGAPALRAETSLGSLYVTRTAPHRVLRLEPQGMLSPSRLDELRSLPALPSMPVLPSLKTSPASESRGMDLSLIEDSQAAQMYDTLTGHTQQLADAVDGGINFSLTTSAQFDCSAAGCTVQASFTGTVSSKARTRLASGGQVTARMTVTNVTIDGRPAGGCVSSPVTISITGDVATGQLSCVDVEAGPVFAAVSAAKKAKAQQQANATGRDVTLRFSSRGQVEIDAVAISPADVTRILDDQKRQRNAEPCRDNSFTAAAVVMSDGARRPINRVQVGEAVLATDPETGATEAQPVTDVIIGQGAKKLVTIDLADRDGRIGSLEATEGHPFWVEGLGRWVEAKGLQPNARLRLPDGHYVTVTATHPWVADREVYNLTVSGPHTYYAASGDFAVLVHNAGRASCALGQAGEAAVSAARGGEPKNTLVLTNTLSGRSRIPDFLNYGKGELGEAKNASYVYLSSQLRDYLDHAKQHSLKMILYVRNNGRTTLSGPLDKLRQQGIIDVQDIIP